MAEPTVDVLNRLYHVLLDGDFYSDCDKACELLSGLREARAAVAELIAENKRLKANAAQADRRSFVDSRIAYRGFSYGMGSQWGIDSLRSAINRNGDA